MTKYILDLQLSRSELAVCLLKTNLEKEIRK